MVKRVLFALMIAVAAHAAGVMMPVKHFTVHYAQHDWDVAYHVPSTYTPERAYPLVLVFHGAGGEGAVYLTNDHWAAQAEAGHFIVVAPTGLPARPDSRANFVLNPHLWNARNLRPGSARARIDDVGFVKQLIGEVRHRWNVDAARVYATGHSNGAGLTFYLATQLPHTFAAIAPVASHNWSGLKAASPVPTLFIIGSEDPLVPYRGGERQGVWSGREMMRPVAPMLSAWSRGMGCAAEATEVSHVGRVRVSEYCGGKAGLSFLEYYVEGQGHGWPGGEPVRLPERVMGPETKDLDATGTIWKFFARWSLH